MRDIECSIVEADIQHYLESRLSAQAVQRAFPELGPSPRQLTTDQMKILVGMSGKLFIIARTASDFILIVLLQDPLPCESLAKLLGVDATRVKGILSNLHSLLSPGTEWLHLSRTPQIILRLHM